MPTQRRSFLLCCLAACAGCMPLFRAVPVSAATVKIESPAVLNCAADSSACEVDLHVTLLADGNCQLTLPGKIEVRGRGADRRMNWTLVDDSTTEEFRIKSFTFIDDTDPPQFLRPTLSPSGLVYSVFNRRTVLNREFHYAIELEHRPATGVLYRSCGADPVVVNKG